MRRCEAGDGGGTRQRFITRMKDVFRNRGEGLDGPKQLSKNGDQLQSLLFFAAVFGSCVKSVL